MDNQNIQIGIDLGTTNSEAAINNKSSIEIIKNVFGDEYTPSVFGVDKSKNKVVGKRAYERLYKDGSEAEFKNNKAEIKRLMGTSETVNFERLNQDLTPEQMSAEILKSLREDILRKHPTFNTQAAVITIPAYFSTLQAEATKRAANLAGFDYAVLLQEPIAAAIAYGFMNSQNENWLVYDLGGGTFDVAAISSKDGTLSVVGHNGDNFLGGKDCDWLIVDKVIVPKIVQDYDVKDFNRGNAKYRSTFAKLKYLAETAKIYLSQYESTKIEIEGVGDDDQKREIYVSIEYSRRELDQLIKPLIDKTIELAQATIKESGIRSSAVHKIILVGGPTQLPCIRERLERDLGISVDSSVDPLTVVAKGACIFATSQRVPQEILQASKPNTGSGIRQITLHFDSLTSETEEPISGVVEDLKGSPDEFYIQIQSDSGFYSGGKIKLEKGKFRETLALEPHKSNLFWIYLFDQQGRSFPISPESFSITHGLSISGAPIPHSIGVAVAKRDFKSGFTLIEVFEPFFEKNNILPLRAQKTFRTVKKIKKGETDNALPIKVYEGESDMPDRNTLICDLRITGENLPYDLPENTEVEITIDVNESREVRVEAFIPTIDMSMNARASLYAEDLNIKELEKELDAQMLRVKSVETTCTAGEKESLDSLSQSVSSCLRSAHLDQDDKRKAHKQLKDLKINLDQMEKEKAIPQLTNDFNAGISEVEGFIDQFAEDQEKEKHKDHLKTLKQEGEKAVSNNDKYLLARVNEQIRELGARVIFSSPATWVYRFEQIVDGGYNFISDKEASYYIDKGKRAISLGDVDELKRCVHNLLLLLPPEEQQAIKSNISGITN